jgi:PAS domain S-box-containing protein
MFKRLTILKKFSLCISALLGLLIASACIGVFGLNTLYTTANHAVANDVMLAQRAALVDILVLNERRFEKDSFINMADPAKLANYRQKWDETRAALVTELAAVHLLELDESDRHAVAQIEDSYRDYTAGFERTFEMIRSGAVKSTQEANTEFSKYKDAVHGTEEASETLNRHAISRVNSVAGTLAATRSRSTALQLGITLLCVALGIILCIATARSITGPLNRAKQVAESVASGNFDNQIDASGADETAKVLAALKTMQESLLENELNAKGQLSAIGKALAVLEFNLDGTLRTANQNFLTLFGYELGQIRGRAHGILLSTAERGAAAERTLWERLRRGEFDAGQYKRITRDGREVYVQASYNPILDLKGMPYKVVMYASDITEQVQMKSALDQAVRDTQVVVQAAIDGELGRRIDTRGKSGQIEALAVSVNALVESMMKVVARIQEAVSEASSATTEISNGSTNLSERTSEQAASLEETSSSMEEMTSAVKASADNAEQARQLALAARERATRGGEILSAAIASMNEISVASTKITDIIGVIDEIAFQTNLLALNAAVEAARAGEQGRGFAVVASEVRSLAGRSASAAKEIKALITDSVNKVAEGSRIVAESGHTLGEINTAVKRVTDVIAEIAAASQEQASGIQQVNRAIGQMDQVTQQNAALAEEATAASQSIVEQITRLAELIARYRAAADTPFAAARSRGARPAVTPRVAAG